MRTKNQSIETDVLFQKLGDTWYVFSEIGGEMVFSALPKGISPESTRVELFASIEEHLKKISKIEKRRRAPQAAA
jgi:hypothetical protein